MAIAAPTTTSPANTIARPTFSLLRGIRLEPHHRDPPGFRLYGNGNNARGPAVSGGTPGAP